jgi:serine/threonine protein kinase
MISPAPLPVKVGDVLAGKYQVERILGLGGMGMVVAARHVDLGELRAVKLMLPQALADPVSVERFLREARAAVRLRGEHVARVHDVGRLEGGEPFIVMEHLEGTDLSRRIHDGGPMDPVEACSCVLDACEALAEAHAAGIVHRDLKPANLFLTTRSDGSACVKVLDFGISKLIDVEGGHELTTTAAVMGSPLYMSPEQIRSSRAVDARADIWALGVILFHLLTGELPFRAESRYELCIRIVQDAVVPPSHFRPVSVDLEAIVLRCLEKEPARRFASVADLAAQLARFTPGKETELRLERIGRLLHRTLSASGGGGSLAPMPEPAVTPAYPGATDSAWNKESPRPRGSRTVAMGSIGLALTAMGGLAAYLVLAPPRGEPSPPLASPDPSVSAASAATAAAAPPTEALPGNDTLPVPSSSASAAPAASSAAASAQAPVARPVAGGPRPGAAKPSADPKPPAAASTAAPAKPPPDDPFGRSRK